MAAIHDSIADFPTRIFGKGGAFNALQMLVLDVILKFLGVEGGLVQWIQAPKGAGKTVTGLSIGGLFAQSENFEGVVVVIVPPSAMDAWLKPCKDGGFIVTKTLKNGKIRVDKSKASECMVLPLFGNKTYENHKTEALRVLSGEVPGCGKIILTTHTTFSRDSAKSILKPIHYSKIECLIIDEVVKFKSVLEKKANKFPPNLKIFGLSASDFDTLNNVFPNIPHKPIISDTNSDFSNYPTLHFQHDAMSFEEYVASFVESYAEVCEMDDAKDRKAALETLRKNGGQRGVFISTAKKAALQSIIRSLKARKLSDFVPGGILYGKSGKPSKKANPTLADICRFDICSSTNPKSVSKWKEGCGKTGKHLFFFIVGNMSALGTGADLDCANSMLLDGFETLSTRDADQTLGRVDRSGALHKNIDIFFTCGGNGQGREDGSPLNPTYRSRFILNIQCFRVAKEGIFIQSKNPPSTAIITRDILTRFESETVCEKLSPKEIMVSLGRADNIETSRKLVVSLLNEIGVTEEKVGTEAFEKLVTLQSYSLVNL